MFYDLLIKCIELHCQSQFRDKFRNIRDREKLLTTASWSKASVSWTLGTVTNSAPFFLKCWLINSQALKEKKRKKDTITIYHLFIIKKTFIYAFVHISACSWVQALTAFDHLVPWSIQTRCSWSEHLYFALRQTESGYLHESPMQGTLNIFVNVLSRQNNYHWTKKRFGWLPEFCHWSHISLQPLFAAWQTLNLFQPPQAEMMHCTGNPEERKIIYPRQ